LRGIPWSFSAHAKDIWLTPEWEKRAKLSRASWGVTCTRHGHEHLEALAPPGRAGDVGLVYHGLDLSRFPEPAGREDVADGSDPAHPVTIVSVGRVVEKKGYDDLVDALALLPSDLCWRFVHIGGGKALRRLDARAQRAGLEGRVEWRGARAQGEIVELLRAADIFVLASRIARDGDRDGLPNVLMEAQSQRVACVATDVSAIPEFILDGETGVLVPPRTPAKLATAIAALARDPALRASLARAGRERLERHFSFAACVGDLLSRFGFETGADPSRRPDLAAAE
jgi:glycosyltransferase involved in cell wall biosynthesis